VKVAKNDKGGDWGRQPNPRFTKRVIITTDPNARDESAP